ncbi:unnamed protein product, partial [Diamesa serratosioi]
MEKLREELRAAKLNELKERDEVIKLEQTIVKLNKSQQMDKMESNVLCGAIEKKHGIILNCEFHSMTYYTCVVTSLDNTNNNMVITGYSGVHKENKTDADVKEIWIHAKYIPTGLGSLFNLTTLYMQNTQLVEIKSQDFAGMENLTNLYLDGNKLTSVPID